MEGILCNASSGFVEKEPETLATHSNGKCGNSITLLDRLSITRCVWELDECQPAQVAVLLSAQRPGTFVITRIAGTKTLIFRTQGNEEASICQFPIKEESSAVYLEGSQLRFQDILELVSFHLVSRDILPCPLRIPNAFRLPSKAKLDAVAGLGMKFWTMPVKSGDRLMSARADVRSPHEDPLESNQPVCSIRVTSEDGALCIVNPLFLSVHSDFSWLEPAPGQSRLSSRRRTLPFSNGLIGTASEEKVSLERLDHPGSLKEEEEEEEEEKCVHLTCLASGQQTTLVHDLPVLSPEPISEDPPLSPDAPQKDIRSPHRVSWIEEGVPDETFSGWPPEKPSSELFLLSKNASLPLIPELDSLSLSSVEEDVNDPPLTPAASHSKRRRSSAALTYKVLHRLSAVGSAISSFLSAERRVSKRVQELAQDPASYVGGLVQSFVGHILRGAGVQHPTSTEMLQEVRQMISNLGSYLCKSSELYSICEPSELEEMNLGSVLEDALYKCILKPLRETIYNQLMDFRSRDGTLGRLRKHQLTMSQQSLDQLGVVAGVPDDTGLERIRTKLSLMHQAYSPKKKETQMLKVCKMLYEAMNQTAGKTEPFGADDFLPVLIYMLVNSDIISVQLDVEYMMELMDPCQMQGEGGYYLTTWFGALFHIANFQPAAMVVRQISIEAQHSIHAWHHRRTIYQQRQQQNTLYISFHEPFSNLKAIAVSNDTTTASVCATCAEKYGVADLESYGLFLVSDDSSQLLAEDSYPQRLHLENLQSKGVPMSFVFKPKVDFLPTDAPLSHQNLLEKWT